jgi:hypothetical protein
VTARTGVSWAGRPKTLWPISILCCGAGVTTSGGATRGRKFATIDRYVNERLAIFASTKHGLRGRNWATRFS